jgi:hypothetical protein
VTVPRSGQHKSLLNSTGWEKSCVLSVVLYGQNTNVSCLCVRFYIWYVYFVTFYSSYNTAGELPTSQGSHVRDEPAATSLEDADVKVCRSSGSVESLINA